MKYLVKGVNLTVSCLVPTPLSRNFATSICVCGESRGVVIPHVYGARFLPYMHRIFVM